MSRRPLRDEMRDLFDDVSEPAHPALAARIRAEIAARGAQPPRPPRLAAAIATVVSVAIVVGLVLAGRHVLPSSPGPVTGAHPAPVASSPAPTPGSTGSSPEPGATSSPAPPAASPAGSPGPALPGFTCATTAAGGSPGPGPVPVTAVRAGPQNGYDRFVVQLDGPVPQYEVRPQASAVFTQDASGLQVTLAGSAGLKVTLHGASGQGTYSGPTDLRPAGTGTLREARQMGDFEGVVTWGLGVSHPACFRAFALTGPSRLVVDVQA
jgi:hypothetical protein